MNSRADHRLDILSAYAGAMPQSDDVERKERCNALNALVQKGLVEVVSVADDGEPSYRLARWIVDVLLVLEEVRE